MSETLHLKPCPICSSPLIIIHDRIIDELSLRPEKLPPLAEDCLKVVAAYKRLKNLGADWQRKHGSRGIVYAQTLLTAVGVQGGQLDRALGVLDYIHSLGEPWDLGSAYTYFGAYSESVKNKIKASMGRCRICAESYVKKTEVGDDCGRH